MAVPAVLNTVEEFIQDTNGGSLSATLSPSPASGNLVLSLMHRDKDPGTITKPSGFTLRASYSGASVGMGFADAQGPAAGGSWSWTGSGTGTAVAVVEMDMAGATLSGAASFPSPASNSEVSSISGNPGTAPSAGIAFAMVSVDSSWDSEGPFADGEDITPTGGYSLIVGPVQQAVSAGDDAGGTNILLFAKEVAAGDSRAFSVSWTGGTDQAGLIMAHYAWSSGPAVVNLSSTIADVVTDAYSNRTSSSGDEAYDVPTSTQAGTLATAFGQMQAGNYQDAAETADPLGYEVVLLSATDTGRDHAMLRERTPCTRYWGLYVVSRENDASSLVLEAPHPKADLYTHTEAGSIYDKGNARALLISTAHRDSNDELDIDDDRVSDLANADGPNPYQSVHEVAATGDATVVQIHGYGNSTDPDFDIIVSEGQPDAGPRTLQLADDLRDATGLRVAVYDGVLGDALGATGNRQGIQSRGAGIYWVHIEQNSVVRGNSTTYPNRTLVEDVVALGLPGPPLVAPGTAFDLSRWHLTTPNDSGEGDAEQIDQPELDSYASPLFYLDENGHMVGIAPVEGATTSGESGATRMELREHEDGSYANSAWNPLITGRRQLTHVSRVDGTGITGPIAGSGGRRQEVVFFQIHGASGTPPIYLTAEWTSSGNAIATPRVRCFVSGTGMANFNLLSPISPTTDIAVRCRVEDAVLKLWCVLGTEEDLPPITADPDFTAPCANFTDKVDWYFKHLTYNKTLIGVGASGEAIVSTSYLELLQPGDADPEPPTTTGALAATALAPSAALAGSVRVTGALAAAPSRPTAAVAADVRTTGSLSTTALAPTIDLSGDGRVLATLATTLPFPSIAGITATVHVVGALAATALRPSFTATGNVVDQRIESTLPLPTASLTGEVNAGPGSIVRHPRIGVDKIGLRVTGGGGDPVRIDFSTNSNMSAVVSSTSVTPGAQGDAHVPIPAGLAPDTVHYFQPWRNGLPFGTVRSFRTLPGAAQTTMTFGFSSCRNTDEDAAVLSTLGARGVDLFLFTGDLHYEDLNTSSASAYRSADDEPYNRTHLGAALTGVPNTQTWDNHDFLGDPSGGWMSNKTVVAQVFRERVPTPDLVPSSGGIYHTFTAWGGRVRFIVLDTRYYRDDVDDDGTMLGAAQLTWLQGLLDDADTALTFIVSSVGWHSDGDDADWGFYPSERATIAGWIAASATEVVLLCGDMHSLAIARPGDGTPGGVHVWHAAALRQFSNGTKGGPYSSGPSYHEDGQYGLVTLSDTGTAITATFNGVRAGASDWSSSDAVTVPTAATGALVGAAPRPTSVITGTVTTTGALASTPPGPGASVFGAIGVPGELVTVAPAPSVELSGAVVVPAELDTTAPSPTAALAATATSTGELAATMPMPHGELSSANEATGELNGHLPVLVAALAADVLDFGELTVSTSAPTAALDADVFNPGALAGSIPLPTAEWGAVARIVGELALVVPMPAARLHAGGLSVPNLVAGAPQQRRGLAAAAPVATSGLHAGLPN